MLPAQNRKKRISTCQRGRTTTTIISGKCGSVPAAHGVDTNPSCYLCREKATEADGQDEQDDFQLKAAWRHGMDRFGQEPCE